MTVYDSFESLKKHTLALGDVVHMTVNDVVYKYRVEHEHMFIYYCTSPRHNGANNLIFAELGIQKIDFCEKVYGYGPDFRLIGDWPQFKLYDYRAATKCMLALLLYVEISKKDKKLDPMRVANIFR